MGSVLVGSQQQSQSHTRTGGGGGGGGGLELELDDSVLPELEEELSDELLELDEELELGDELLDGDELDGDELDDDELDDDELGAELDEEELLGGALLLELEDPGGMIPLEDEEELGADEELEEELELDGKLLELDEELLELDMTVTPISPPCGFVGPESSERILKSPKCYSTLSGTRNAGPTARMPPPAANTHHRQPESRIRPLSTTRSSSLAQTCVFTAIAAKARCDS